MSRMLGLVLPGSSSGSGSATGSGPGTRQAHKAHSSELDLNLAGGPNLRRPSVSPSAGLDEGDVDMEVEAEAERDGEGDGESQPLTPEPDVSGPMPTITPVGQLERADRGVGVRRHARIGEGAREGERGGGGGGRDGEGAPGPHRRHTASQSQGDADPLLHSYRGNYPGAGHFAPPLTTPDADADAAATRPMHAFHTRPAPIAAPAPGTLLYSKGIIRKCV